MSAVEIAAFVIGCALAVFLFYALLYPEKL